MKKMSELFLRRQASELSLLLLLVCFLLYPAPAHANPGQNSGQVRRLIFTVKTADDDLRGGNDNLNVVVNFRDGNIQAKPNVNRGQTWPNNTTREFDIELQRPVAISAIDSISFKKPTGGGFGTDEWHMTSVIVRATIDGMDRIIATHGFMVFDLAHEELTIPVTPAVAGKANKLELTVKTGDDDLKGNPFNLDVTIRFRNGASQLVTDVNGGKTWQNGSTHVETITLDRAVDPSDITRIDLKKFGGMLAEFPDNWDMESISIKALGEGVDQMLAHHGFFRFTQSQSSLSIPVGQTAPGKASRIELTIQTGGDDLRGDNDNLNIIVHFRGGQTQLAQNINGGKAWHNESMHVETITLERAVDISDIVEVDLQTTFTGGSGGDNWDMDSVSVKAIGEGINEVIFRHGRKRFTGDDKVLRLRRGE